MKAVLFYDTGNTPMEAFKAAYPRHKAVMGPLIEQKEVLEVGTFNGGRDGSMAIFKNRGAAEAFVKLDPFVTEGLVVKHSIRDWDDNLIG